MKKELSTWKIYFCEGEFYFILKYTKNFIGFSLSGQNWWEDTKKNTNTFWFNCDIKTEADNSFLQACSDSYIGLIHSTFFQSKKKTSVVARLTSDWLAKIIVTKMWI